ncbi:lipase isoform X2 [Benincasa hispida]|uniref:lipase isoform X2 n=1 Tax=Benincasa hispida TaxID=102211 RepID=UPI0019026532|nr:lipase isoform X2 [Benincasa hispida]
MERHRWLTVAIFACLIVFSVGREFRFNHKRSGDAISFNHTLAEILVEYASAAYISDLTELFTWTCTRCDGLTQGFEVIELVVDVQHCLQAYVGVAESLNAVIIAFRGTQENSIQNWIEDLYWKQLDLMYPGMPDAMVHHGFYYAYHNTTIRPAILSAVDRARKFYGNLDIMVTGHSMGGAMAAFCGLDLAVMTFGQPRIGNAVFASYYSNIVPNTFRVTNGNDVVPHLPPFYSYFPKKTYRHFPREVWLYNVGFGSFVFQAEKICDGSGEDPSCSRSVSGKSISDHLVYYGVELSSPAWRSCRFVMDPPLAAYGATDLNGNRVFSKVPGISLIRLNEQSVLNGESW